MKYFIASSWTNMKKVQFLTENLKSFGHEVFSFVPDNRNFVPQTEITPAPAFADLKDWQEDQKLREIFEHTLEGLRVSDTVILLLPAGRNSHLQAGVADGLNKRLVLIGEIESPEPYYLLFDEWHKNIESYLALLKTKLTA